MENFFKEKSFQTLNLLHNNHFCYNEYGICGTRGWINETEEPADKKVLLREAGRLESSIASAEKAGLVITSYSIHYTKLYDVGKVKS